MGAKREHTQNSNSPFLRVKKRLKKINQKFIVMITSSMLKSSVSECLPYVKNGKFTNFYQNTRTRSSSAVLATIATDGYKYNRNVFK